MSQTMQPRDRLIPWYFVAFFIVIAAVDGVMVTLAVRTQTGVVTDHAYERGLAYNQVVTAADAQAQLNWKGDIRFQPQAERKGALTFSLRDEKGNTIKPETLKAKFSRPTQAGMDFTVQLKDVPADVEFPAAGLWEIRIYATYKDHAFQQAVRIVVE